MIMFSPKKIINGSDIITDLEVKYHGSKIPVNNNELINILSKYDTMLSLTDYFPYKIEKIDFEINFIYNSRPFHILLGEFNIWYESADMPAHNIINSQQLEDELKKELNL
jgi:hypothetical protein